MNLYFSNFTSQSLLGSGDISFFIWYVTSWNHVMAGSCNFAGCGPSTQLTSLPSGVAISLLEAEIWCILIFNVRRRILWLSHYKVWQWNFAGFFDIIRITKCDKLLLQSASGITKCDKLLLQSVTDFITKCVRYYKVRQLLQNET